MKLEFNIQQDTVNMSNLDDASLHRLEASKQQSIHIEPMAW